MDLRATSCCTVAESLKQIADGSYEKVGAFGCHRRPSSAISAGRSQRPVYWRDYRSLGSRAEMLGISGVQETARQSSSLPAEEVKRGVLGGVADWREGPRIDDVSLLLVPLERLVPPFMINSPA